LLLTLLIAGAFAGAEPLPVLAPVPADTHAEVYRAPGQLHVFLSGATPGLLDLRRTSDRAADDGRDAPTCSAQGIDLFAYELATEAWIPAVCAALESSPPEIPIGPRVPAGADEHPPITWTATRQGIEVYPALIDADGHLGSALWPWRPLHPLVLIGALLAAALAPRRKEPWLIALFALVVRVALTSERAVLEGDHPFQRFVTATGLAETDWPHGDTWAAVLGPVWLLFGGPDRLPHAASLVASVLTVAYLWGLVEAWFDDRAANTAALMLAVLPLPVALARSEDDLALATLLQVWALYGLARGDRRGGVFTAIAVGLLANLNAVHLPFTMLPIAALTANPRHRVSAVAALLLTAGGAFMAGKGMGANPDHLASLHLEDLPNVFDPGYVVGPGGRLAPSDPSVSPIGVTALAITSLLWVPPPFRTPMQALWGALAITTLPYLHLPGAVEAVRLQLPAQTWLTALAGVAFVCVDPRARRLWVLVLGLSWVLSSSPLSGGAITWTAEHAALRDALAYVPEDAAVSFQPVSPGSPWQQRYYQLQMRGVWLPQGKRPLQAGEYRWIGRSDADLPDDGCSLRPVVERMVPVRQSPDSSATPTELHLGLFEVRSCGQPPQEPPPLPTAPEPVPEDRTPIPTR
jgi:hypothetical protein